jgi:fructose-1,6-bisphosphatase
MEIKPERVHQRIPVFLGSYDDVVELESYYDN